MRDSTKVTLNEMKSVRQRHAQAMGEVVREPKKITENIEALLGKGQVPTYVHFEISLYCGQLRSLVKAICSFSQ